MSTIFLTGGNGFIGGYFYSKLFITHNIVKYIRNTPVEINANYVFHLAGVAHDIERRLISKDYFLGNYVLTKVVFDAFLISNAKVFVTVSSVNAVIERSKAELNESQIPEPTSLFGQSKLLAEEYILSKEIPEGKRVYILRPCMVHGPGNKGNLNLLYKLISKGIPWPLGAFENQRSFCSVDNLMFIFKELIEREDIPSGIYNVADDVPFSTNELIGLIAQSQNRKSRVWKISSSLIEKIARVGDKFRLPLNSERLQKLTSSYVVSNAKIKAAIGKPLPVSSRDGLMNTFKSFQKN
jgi:nucleoside-diphosphate-sugar epimerase